MSQSYSNILDQFNICNFCCDFQGDILFLMDVNEKFNNECAVECTFPHLNIRTEFTRSHPSKGENCTTNSNKVANVNRPLLFELA